jgi:flavine halogenase
MYTVIQGTADAGKRLTEDELQKTLDFCQHVVAPTDTSMFDSVATRVDSSLLQPDAPVMSASDIEKVVGEGDDEAKMVLGELNARKPVYLMTGKMELEEVEGLKVRVERGSLGLIPA